MIIVIDPFALSKACDAFLQSQLADDYEMPGRSKDMYHMDPDDLMVEQAIRATITAYLEQVSK